MNKVKITVLKTTLDKELADEYGAPGLKACPMLQEGQVFYADYAKPDGFCDERGKRSINMLSRWRTERETMCSITATGSASQGWPSAAATTGCVP